MRDAHAKLFSPSKADGWFACAGRAVMEAAFPDSGNEYSDDGTARHAVCAEALRENARVDEFIGCFVHLESGRITVPNVGDDDTGCLVYLEDWAEEDQDYVDTVRALAEGGELFVERQLDFRRFIECADPDDGFGTGDAVILKPLADNTYELIVVDRKTGYHEVPVERNKQLQLYALGAYDEYCMVYEISRVRLIIHQRTAREWDCSIADLLKFAEEARSRAITVVNAVRMHGQVDQGEWERTFLNQQPSVSACAYCKAMATCPSMQRTVQSVVGAEFDDMASGDVEFNLEECAPASLAKCMQSVELIEDFCKAVRAETERRLLAGQSVDGFKLVLGKAGARQWKNADEAETALKSMRLKVEEMYDLKVISPTSAEKLAKAKVLGPRQWVKLQPLIGRSEPKPSVAPVTDKRDAYTPPNTGEDFQHVADEAADLA